MERKKIKRGGDEGDREKKERGDRERLVDDEKVERERR